MEDPRTRSTLSFTLILCFSLWLTPGETFWDQCTDECPVKYFTSTYDVRCSDKCEKRGSDYYWCNTQEGWDYCSPAENTDYKGNTCTKDSPCGNYRGSFYQCSVWGGSWEKCGRVEPRAMIYNTRYQKQCVDSCQYYRSGEYFWCHDGDDWEYCSPLPDHTYKNEPCRQNHECGTHGQNYTWCYTTDNNDWDYCGVISPGEFVFSHTHRVKRQPNNQKKTCKIAECNNALYNEALDLINRWDNQRLSDRPRSNLITSNNLRIDNQRLFNRDNQRFYNLQIQIKGPRPFGRSTTIAHINVPVDTSAEDMREAFKESLRDRVTVELGVDEASTSTNNNKKSFKRPKG